MTDFYDAIYRSNPNVWSKPARDEFAFAALKDHEPASMLDIGCGSGHTLRYFMDRWPEVEYYGVDTSKVALELARKNVKGATFFDDLWQAPRVTLIAMMGVLEHFPELAELRNVRQHLAPGGRMYIEVPNCLNYSQTQEEGFRPTNGRNRQTEWHLRRTTWEKTLTENGLEIITSLKGLNEAWEFVWLCRQSNLSIGM